MQPISYGGPVNIITLASTNPDAMWAVGTDRVRYVCKTGGQWTTLAKFEAFADASGNAFPAIPDENFRTFGESTAVGMTVDEMDTLLENLFGADYGVRFGNGAYSVVVEAEVD